MVNDIKDFLPVNSEVELFTYHKILDNTAIIILMDSQEKIKYVNKKFCEISGYNANEITGKYLNVIKSGYHSEEYYKQVKEILFSGKVFRGEFLQRKKNGETYWEETCIYPFIDEKNKVYQFISIGSDITSFKNAMQIKDQFLANMSHELRTPLHSLVSLSNLLAETSLTNEQTDYLENIQNATNILMKMVEDMLDLNKIESGQIRFENKIFNPQVLINSLVKMFTGKVRQKKLEFIVQYDATLPEFIVGDPFRLKQVLIHLIENSVKYTHSGGIKLSCKLARQTSAHSYFEIVVEDTGIGIAPENLDIILEKFQQVRMDDKRSFGGQGLGLSIAKQLIKLQNGQFNITSQENIGTRVSFSIPYLNAGKESNLKPETSETEFIPAEKNVSGTGNSCMKVLIAEDVDINQLVIKKHMQKFGFSADFAENGKVAIDKLSRGNYDIILMDMQMPVMDGYEAIKKIRAEFPTPKKNMPIISITASVLGEAPNKCLEAGADDYVPKPYDVMELRKKMESLVAEKKIRY
jgi:PAS domain S-box-containing protein